MAALNFEIGHAVKINVYETRKLHRVADGAVGRWLRRCYLLEICFIATTN